MNYNLILFILILYLASSTPISTTYKKQIENPLQIFNIKLKPWILRLPFAIISILLGLFILNKNLHSDLFSSFDIAIFISSLFYITVISFDEDFRFLIVSRIPLRIWYILINASMIHNIKQNGFSSFHIVYIVIIILLIISFFVMPDNMFGASDTRIMLGIYPGLMFLNIYPEISIIVHLLLSGLTQTIINYIIVKNRKIPSLNKPKVPLTPILSFYGLIIIVIQIIIKFSNI